MLQNTHFSMDRGQVAEMEGDSLPKAFLFGNLVSGRLIRENIKKQMGILLKKKKTVVSCGNEYHCQWKTETVDKET